MTRQCEIGGELSDDDATTFCHEHFCPTATVTSAAAQTPPPVHTAVREDSSGRRQWSKDVCWHCGKPTPSSENELCLQANCYRPLIPPAVHIKFPHGEVEAQPGERVELGRHGAHSAVFSAHANVSRRHAAVVVDNDGQIWIEELRALNGTFVNGVEIAVATRKALVPGDGLRFAADVPGEVTIFDRR